MTNRRTAEQPRVYPPGMGTIERLAVVAILALIGVAAWATFTSPQKLGTECGKWPSPGWSIEDVDTYTQLAETTAALTGQPADGSELRAAARMCDDALSTRKTVALTSVGLVVAVPFGMAFVLYRRPKRPATVEH